jgi:hypothetical protein
MSLLVQICALLTRCSLAVKGNYFYYFYLFIRPSGTEFTNTEAIYLPTVLLLDDR